MLGEDDKMIYKIFTQKFGIATETFHKYLRLLPVFVKTECSLGTSIFFKIVK